HDVAAVSAIEVERVRELAPAEPRIHPAQRIRQRVPDPLLDVVGGRRTKRPAGRLYAELDEGLLEGLVGHGASGYTERSVCCTMWTSLGMSWRRLPPAWCGARPMPP